MIRRMIIACAIISAPMMGAHHAGAMHKSACTEDAIEYRMSMRSSSHVCIALEDIAGSPLWHAAISMIDYCGARNAIVMGGHGGPYGRCIMHINKRAYDPLAI